MLGDSKLLCWDDRAAAQILHKKNSLLVCERSDCRRRRRLAKTTHEKVAARNFQNRRAPGTTRTAVIIDCRFVGGSHLAQGCPRGFDYLANSKTAPDLDHLTKGDDDFVLRRRAR